MGKYIPEVGDFFRVKFIQMDPRAIVNEKASLEAQTRVFRHNKYLDDSAKRCFDIIYYCSGGDATTVVGNIFFNEQNRDSCTGFYVIEGLTGIRIPNNEKYSLKASSPKVNLWHHEDIEFLPVGPKVIEGIFNTMIFNPEDMEKLGIANQQPPQQNAGSIQATPPRGYYGAHLKPVVVARGSDSNTVRRGDYDGDTLPSSEIPDFVMRVPPGFGLSEDLNSPISKLIAEWLTMMRAGRNAPSKDNPFPPLNDGE